MRDWQDVTSPAANPNLPRTPSEQRVLPVEKKKTPPSGRPDRVKALDGVSPQPRKRQRFGRRLQAFVIEVHDALRIAHH